MPAPSNSDDGVKVESKIATMPTVASFFRVVMYGHAIRRRTERGEMHDGVKSVAENPASRLRIRHRRVAPTEIMANQ